jgi:aldehyde:ferredoxin oxidoreductase
MHISTNKPGQEPHKVVYRRCVVDLSNNEIQFEDAHCEDLEDVLGGFGRSFKMLAKRNIQTAYCTENPLIVNTGLLTGSNIMTGMRTYFSAYSPLKESKKGLPAAMWSASSGKFGSQLKWTGLDELVFENRSEKPVYALIREGENGPVVELKPADHLLGLSSHEKIMSLYHEYPINAQFAAIGQAGENFETVYMGAVALSTDNELRSGEDKCRFAGRGGMGSLMGYKNLIALVAQSKDKLAKITPEVKKVNLEIVKGGGSSRFQPISQGGNGGTWASYGVLQAFCAVPENNFRPKGNDVVELLFRENVEKELDVKSEGCFRCGIRCHNNIYRRKPDGTTGDFIAKFDFEPLNLLGTNLGIHNGGMVAELVKLADNYGMDAISLGCTISYILDYNERHPLTPLCNGANFGEYDKIRDLIVKAGCGELPQVGRGLKRLADETGEASYAMHVKGLELPAYLPDTNPGYPWAIAGGHMSMSTYLLLAREGKTDLQYWVNSITQNGLLVVGYDMIGLCKFIGVGINHRLVTDAIKESTGLEISQIEISASVRRAFMLGLALERKQGYSKEEYTLPSQVFEQKNHNVKLPHLITPEFFAELSEKVWNVFEKEMPQLSPSY